MTIEKLDYKDARYFSDLMCDYMDGSDVLKGFYGFDPALENFKNQIDLKGDHFPIANRNKLVDSLLDQYKQLDDKEHSTANIKLLKDQNTFTITTGHQLNLFTGPLYFLYKILSVINLCKQLKQQYPQYDFVPIYWMATEDHDFEEIRYFNYEGRKLVWDRESSGAVGRLDTKGLELVLKELRTLLGNSDNAQFVIDLFEKSYLHHDNLADATRYLAHQLFGNDGLVIVDGDDARVKKLMIPYFEEELLNQTSFKQVSKTIDNWPDSYKVQVNPREINLFYLTDELRERIVYEDNLFKVINTDLSLTKDEILQELKNHPERFSPNVILRPFYQEVILPNLCYIGGGGEMAYWLELKNYFDSQKVPFPILLMRNSALLMSQKQQQKLNKLDLKISDLFLKEHQLEELITKKHSEITIDFTRQRDHLRMQFEELHQLAQQTDPSFKGAVGAQEQKQINGLNHLEKRLLKAQKRKLSDYITRATALQLELFPQHNLQERKENFASFYKEYGDQLITTLKNQLDPLDQRFTTIVLED